MGRHVAVIRIRQHYPFWGPLAERFELIAFDFRNHGSNPPAASGKDGHTYAQMALDLDAQGIRD